MRLNANAIVRENCERGSVFNQAHIRGAQGQWQIRGQRRSYSEPFRHLYNFIDADFFRNFHGGNVSRTVHRAAQRNYALEMSVIILGRIILTTAYDGVRRVQNRVEWAEARLHRSRVDVNFKRAANLSI